MNLHALNLQATHTAILRWSVEGFHSLGSLVRVWHLMGLQTTFKLKVIHLLSCSVKRVTVLLLSYCTNFKAGL